MMRRSFLGLTTPRFQYDTLIGKLPAPVDIAAPKRVTLLIEGEAGRQNGLPFRAGDAVSTGQKLSLETGTDAYTIASVSGVIRSIEPFPGEAGRRYTAVSVDAAPVETFDPLFEARCAGLSIETARDCLAFLPGGLSLKGLDHGDPPIRTIVINAMDRDLLVVTARYVLASALKELKKGIDILRSMTGVDDIVIAAPRDTLQGYGEIGASVIAMDTAYPYGSPYFIAQRVLGKEVPVNQPFESFGLCFLNVEAVAALGRSVERKRIAAGKLITFIDKQGNRSLVRARIGAPLSDIFDTFGLTLNDQDRIIIGGPMTGFTVPSASYPVQPHTDAVMVQNREDITRVSDYPCINCGECIRVCPARIQVHLLIRFLEAGQFAEAADNYDLFSCLECGLCSFVCVARIPVFQHIKLAKYELGKVTAEETADE